MKRRLASAVFVYGCVSSIVCVVWLSAALLSANVRSSSLWLMESLFVLHGCALVLTFHRSSGTVLWLPVLRVTSQRIKAAQAILLITALDMAGWLAAIFVLALQNYKAQAEWALSPFLASAYLLSGVYIALHWAFRQKNLLPRAFLAFVGNPFGAIVRRLLRQPKT